MKVEVVPRVLGPAVHTGTLVSQVCKTVGNDYRAKFEKDESVGVAIREQQKAVGRRSGCSGHAMAPA